MELQGSFLQELFKAALYKKEIIEAIRQHVKFEFIPTSLPQYKKILKDLVSLYSNNDKIPSIGQLSQLNATDSKIQATISEIGNTKLQDTDQILDSLQDFIKKSRFVALHDKVTTLYNNDKADEAMQLLNSESAEIVNFSLRSSVGKYKKVFAGFKERQDKRQIDRLNGNQYAEKIPTGIDELDSLTYGGVERGQSELMIARSGSGKTTYLIHRAITGARRGFKVLFVSAEDTEERLLAKLDSSWTAQSFKDIRNANISAEFEAKLEKIYTDIIGKGAEIDVVAFEQFDTASIKDIREIILEYVKVNGKPPDLLIVDYLEKFSPGDGKRYSASMDSEKARRQAIAEKITNLAIEFKLVSCTAMQASDIAPEHYNRPEFRITRHNASGDKGIINPFSLVITYNTTNDEYQKNLARIYVDKMRDTEGDRIIKIATAFNNGRFYDRKRTLELFDIE
jgi:KaiC/GvpD/RAD55 family RecA-like ATPase